MIKLNCAERRKWLQKVSCSCHNSRMMVGRVWRSLKKYRTIQSVSIFAVTNEQQTFEKFRKTFWNLKFSTVSVTYSFEFCQTWAKFSEFFSFGQSLLHTVVESNRTVIRSCRTGVYSLGSWARKRLYGWNSSITWVNLQTFVTVLNVVQFGYVDRERASRGYAVDWLRITWTSKPNRFWI